MSNHNSHSTMYCDRQTLVNSVFTSCQNVFPDLDFHTTDTDPLTNYMFLLVKAVSKTLKLGTSTQGSTIQEYKAKEIVRVAKYSYTISSCYLVVCKDIVGTKYTLYVCL